MPDPLKAGIEHLSRRSLDDVQVHFNSSKPAQLQAHAFTQGAHIYVAPGQEKHLAHEAWHVVQQKQGRVIANRQLHQRHAINDDPQLEREADIMGSRAAQMPSQLASWKAHPASDPHPSISEPTIQRKVGFEIEVLGYTIDEPGQGSDIDPFFQDSDEEIQVHDEPQRQLQKGEILHQGAGWKLTPDARVGHHLTPEYIIAAVDETTATDTLLDAVSGAARHAQNDLAHPERWSNGQHLETSQTMDDILGNFHITGGLRLSRISQLIKVLYNTQDAQDPETDHALARRAENISWRGDNYKSVIALVALQVKDLLSSNLEDQTSAKLGVTLLSRTNLSDAISKVSTFVSRESFIRDVLATARAQQDQLLFRHVLPGNQGSGRTIDDQQDLTVGAWLDRIFSARDFVWSETQNDQGGAFGLESVGPRTLGHRAEGIILELRGGILEQGNYSPFVQNWRATAAKYARLFRTLNAKATFTDIVNAYNEGHG